MDKVFNFNIKTVDDSYKSGVSRGLKMLPEGVTLITEVTNMVRKKEGIIVLKFRESSVFSLLGVINKIMNGSNSIININRVSNIGIGKISIIETIFIFIPVYCYGDMIDKVNFEGNKEMDRA